MANPRPEKIELTEREREILERIVRRQKTAQSIARRARAILDMGAGNNNTEVEQAIGMSRQRIGYWRKNWLAESPRLATAQAGEVTEKELEAMIIKVLSDEARAGTPATFTAQQIVQIVAVACEKPEESERPISHWTTREVTDEVIKRSIVNSISIRQVGRFLKSGGFEATQNGVLVKCSTR